MLPTSTKARCYPVQKKRLRGITRVKRMCSFVMVRYTSTPSIIFSQIVSGKQVAADHCHSEDQLSLLPNVLALQAHGPSL